MGSIFLKIKSPLLKATSLTSFTTILRCENIHAFFPYAAKLFSVLMWYDSCHHLHHAFIAGSYLFILPIHCFLNFILTEFNKIDCFCATLIQSLA